jgi:hypothetical protein
VIVLWLASGGDECGRGGLQEWGRLARAEDVRADESSVDKQRKLTSQFVRALDVEALGDPLETAPEFLLVR